MTKSVKVKIILIISFLTLSALIMAYKYFTEFKQTQIDKAEQEASAWDSPINQFEFAGDPLQDDTMTEAQISFGQNQNTQADNQTQNKNPGDLISQIITGPQTFVNIQYSTQPFVKVQNAEEISQRIAHYGKDPVIRNFIKDMSTALGTEATDLSSLPPAEEMRKKLASTQTQKILLQYSKDPAFIKAMQKAMEDPDFAAGFINYIQNQTEQESSK